MCIINDEFGRGMVSLFIGLSCELCNGETEFAVPAALVVNMVS